MSVWPIGPPAAGERVKSEHGSHIRIHTTYNSIMFTYNICRPDDKRRVNTDLPPLKLGEHKINNIERATTPNMRINNLHAIYMILCKMHKIPTRINSLTVCVKTCERSRRKIRQVLCVEDMRIIVSGQSSPESCCTKTYSALPYYYFNIMLCRLEFYVMLLSMNFHE
jgi:hypothetical protein